MNMPTPLPLRLPADAFKYLIVDPRVDAEMRAQFAIGASGLSSPELVALAERWRVEPEERTSMNTPTPLPLILTPEAIRRMISEPLVEIGARTRCALGACGLSSAEVRALDIAHVSTDGIGARSVIIVPTRDGRRPQLQPTRRQAISDDARWLLGCWLEVRRRRCEHHDRLMRTYTDERGIRRCGACREVLDLLAAPLFDSRESDRMSLSAIRHEFQRVRDMLRLDPSFHFDSLREAYLARQFSAGSGQK